MNPKGNMTNAIESEATDTTAASPTQEETPPVTHSALLIEKIKERITEFKKDIEALANLKVVVATHAAKFDSLPRSTVYKDVFGRFIFDFDNLGHAQVMELLKTFPGRWKKELSAVSTKIDYSTTFDGAEIRAWAGEPPPSCKIIEEEVEVPARKEMRRRLVCHDTEQKGAE